jgi:hypothetical protein
MSGKFENPWSRFAPIFSLPPKIAKPMKTPMTDPDSI